VTRGVAVLRFDAGPRVGLGHLMRSLAIARRLEIDGWECALAVSPETARAAAPWLDGPRPLLAIGDAGEDAGPLRAARPEGCDALIVDHYDRGLAFERSCRTWARSVVAVEDRPLRPHECDVLIDPTPAREASAYDSLVPAGATLCCGADFAPLRDEFFALRIARDAERSAAAGRIAVALGGGDIGAALARLLDGLAETANVRPVDVIASRAAAELEAVKRAFDRLPPGSRLHVDTGHAAAILADAAIAIGAGGVGALERTCLGLPSLALKVADNQRDVLTALDHAGAALVLGSAADVRADRLDEALRRLAEDNFARIAMQQAASRLCDGLGARRIALALSPERESSGAAVELRPARWSDCDIMLQWQSHPATRRYAHTNAVPSRREHEAWLRRRLDDVRTLLNIVEVAARPAGVLRLDCIDAAAQPQRWKISIFVDPDRYGRGIGLAALRCARRLLPEMEFAAEVLPENERSHRLFRRAGYVAREGGYADLPPKVAA
jgi:UDP-2,4-diacetamido-2,4,6-trideoxy-beta-L-altropyranose hydrolase